MNKVKKGQTYTHEGWFGKVETRFTWICAECGREWYYRNYAQRCEHHDQLLFYSHDDIAYCLNKGGLNNAL